ncbi:MAG: hypothetical protein C4536_14165 [Actinobacteria bacterium]|jgi:hypothetical protein|nr:MAG: hypothetical protein C4536_14165 [Actinomycetota bacterium]
MIECEAAWPSADTREQAVLICLGLALLAYGGGLVARFRRRWFCLWLAALLLWSFLSKYLICTRCESYGKPCDFCYGGKYAALFFKPQPERTLDASGMITEGVSVALISLLPAVAAREDKRELALYLVVLTAFQAALYHVCCSKCVIHSRESWKRDICPNYKVAKVLNRLSGRASKG